MEKKRIIKNYNKLPEEIHEQIKLHYPSGFSQNLMKFTNKEGLRVSALPFETPEIYYLIRMTFYEAQAIIEEDDDYDGEGLLKDDSREKYEDKHNEENEDLDDY